jgi:hypothetical protein
LTLLPMPMIHRAGNDHLPDPASVATSFAEAIPAAPSLFPSLNPSSFHDTIVFDWCLNWRGGAFKKKVQKVMKKEALCL